MKIVLRDALKIKNKKTLKRSTGTTKFLEFNIHAVNK